MSGKEFGVGFRDHEESDSDNSFGFVVMLGVIILLYLILSHLFYNSFKDCLKFYLKKYIKKLSDGIPTFLATYFLSLLIVYLCLGIFVWIFTEAMHLQDIFNPRDFFKYLSRITR